MGKITVETTKIAGLKVITPQVFGDERGYFTTILRKRELQRFLCKIISLHLRKACSADFISR